MPDDSAFRRPGSAKRVSSIEAEEGFRKKAKTEAEPAMAAKEKYNPYLAHMYDNDTHDGFSPDAPSPNSPLAGFKRRKTTAKQAATAEDSDVNPFTGVPHSQQYFQILEKRRDLPVHKQRYRRRRDSCFVSNTLTPP
jgi:pre-mRNA-splicing factor ATP-dependent RNA helicase DHX15/PRP43